MPTNFEFEFNQDDKDLIISQQENSSFGDGALFSVRNFDYIRLTIYPTEGLDNIVTLPNNTQGVNGKAIFFSSLSETSFYINIMPFIGGTNVNDGKLIGGDNNDFKIYKKDIPGSPSEIYIKPNDVFEQFELPQGNYRIQIDFLNQVKTPIQTPDQSDLSEYTESYLIENAGQQEITWTLSEFIPTLNNMPAEIFRIYNSNFQEIYYRNDYLDGNFDNPNYGQPLVNGEIYYIQLAQSNFAPYTWNPLVIPNLDASETYNFIIKQISTSRKEVRLKLFDKNITNDSSIITDLTNVLNGNELQTVDAFNYLESNPPFLPDGETPNPNYKYQFKHVLNVGTGDHVPIMNYTFDRVTDGKNNQSIILKLYEPLTTAVSNLQMVTIEKEVLTTQLQDIYYFSDVPDVFFGDGLIPDTQQNWISPDNNQIGFESLDELAFSASIGEIETNYLISQSEYNYPNLNTDFNEYENHTFFGSAKKKLVNFKTKVETIQSYYTDISSSLVVSSSIDGDSTYIINYRKNLFNKINDEFKTFTPYERFLYYDGQSDTTASAPSLVNLSHKKPLTANDNYLELNQHDGFNIVYKSSNQSSSRVSITENLYKVQNKPFHNHSGSVYLSFLLKGTDNSEIIRKNTNATFDGYVSNGFYLPEQTAYTSSILQPDVTGSEYRRFIFEASQSYFVGGVAFPDLADINNWENEFQTTVLSGNIKTASYQIQDSTGLYPTTVVTQSGVPFFGSVMPAGDLFHIYINSGSAVTQSFITDVKVTTVNPTSVLPFDSVFKTTSDEWTDWYNNALTQAETFDTNNIHSFENNLPLYIQESSEYNDMKDFLALQGEQYDLIRNHIDSLGTLHKRGYKETNSPPNNTLPMLLNNMGWEAIYPFQSGSLTETLGGFLSGVTTLDDIKNNTWRKTLNNLLYIYKSKGTKNSVRGLLNIYGYPPDVVEFQEFGGSSNKNHFDELNPVINDDLPDTGSQQTDIDLSDQTGSIGFTRRVTRLNRYMFNNIQDRSFSLDWWMDDANINTIEFVYKHKKTTQTQTILESSGSNAEKLWDLRLIPSSDGASSSFEFRLNNSQRADSDIGERGFSMSLAYNNMSDGQLWNVMLQRMTSSINGPGIQEYRLHTALQKSTTIQTYDYNSMEVSGGLAGGSTLGGKGFFANQNFQSSGTLHPTTGSPNLVVGREFSGSLAEIKAWATPLSVSKFRAHTLNKLSTIGNSINSYRDDLIYHFKLNENYSTSSVSESTQKLKIVDSSPTTNYSDYSFLMTGSIFTSSRVHGFDLIEVVKPAFKDNFNQPNDNGIIISPDFRIIDDLNPYSPGIESLTNTPGKKPQYRTSPKLELYRSPQDYIDNFILDNLSGFNLEKLYGNPIYYISQSYDEFDTFRENFFEANPIEVDTNKFIRAHETMFNYSMIDGIKQVIPVRSTFSDLNSNFGVEIKPTILEKQKYEHHNHSVETNPNTATGSIITTPDLSNSEFVQPKTGSIDVNVINTVTIETPYTASIKVSDSGSVGNPYLEYAYTSISSSIVNPYIGSVSTSPTLNGSSIVTSKDGTIDYASEANKSYVDIHKNWGTGSNDTHFINYAGGTSSRGDYNVGHIENRFIFYAVGDNEYYSASMGKADDFTDSSRFYSRLMIDTDIHANVTYQSLVGGSGSDSNLTGRMMGKTRYFITSSDGTITLPSNHVNKFSYPFKEKMYEGAQNTDPGILNVRQEDLSTASFYRVTVTGGEQIMYIGGGAPSKGTDDRIIYDDIGGG